MAGFPIDQLEILIFLKNSIGGKKHCQLPKIPDFTFFGGIMIKSIIHLVAKM
jgi:hypothetical protein